MGNPTTLFTLSLKSNLLIIRATADQSESTICLINHKNKKTLVELQ